MAASLKQTDVPYHKPFIRSALAKSLYERMMREEQLRKFDKEKWYKINLDSLNDVELQEKFMLSSCDAGTDEFLVKCHDKSDWFFTQIFHSIARTILSAFMTSTSVNGFLGRGSMFVFSEDQFKKLYDGLSWDSNSRVLDLGAGDGRVTEVMAKHFSEVHATEISPVMKRILAKKGYKVLDIDKWTDEPGNYDLISCLNLLDRCDKPLTIISQIKSKLKPGGRILLALVLPFSQYVEHSGTSGNNKPSEVINITGSTFEEQLVTLSANVLKPNGLEVVRWTRLPYLCEGDLDLSFYWLHDVVMLLKQTESN
ncbi:Protein-L-histidine N-pros-methyltransferase [Halotydeus destructor]|nr:Protein-L-histidine N-pros-methyltransferase [Halotydeus destructor]